MFYLLQFDGTISMCQFLEGWVYAWHFRFGKVTGGGRLNPSLVTLKLLDKTWDIRLNVNLRVPDRAKLEKEFAVWCDRWFKDDPRKPKNPSLVGEIPVGQHQIPGAPIQFNPWE